jgi:hypothetical protein
VRVNVVTCDNGPDNSSLRSSDMSGPEVVDVPHVTPDGLRMVSKFLVWPLCSYGGKYFGQDYVLTSAIVIQISDVRNFIALVF